ncbi:MAG: response regulator, partial [Deltaproteobacteria bacterium]|nr:response regulator [Deltaproteobacteria bacterium]
SRPEYERLLSRVAAIPEVGKENILVVEQDEVMIEAFNTLLCEHGIIETARSSDEAFEKLKDKYYAVIVTDVGVESDDGIEFYKKAVERFPGINKRFLFLTEYDSDYMTFLENNGLRYFEKPSSIKDIKTAVSETIMACAGYDAGGGGGG